MIVKNGADILVETEQLAYESEKHVHGRERWFGNGFTEASLTGYSLVSGNAAFGAETALMSAANTPVIVGMTKFDLHRIFITALSSATPYVVRIIYGTGTVGDAETAGQYSDCYVTSSGVGSNLRGAPVDIMMPRGTAGATKVWAKCKNATNLATIEVTIGLHEYVR